MTVTAQVMHTRARAPCGHCAYRSVHSVLNRCLYAYAPSTMNFHHAPALFSYSLGHQQGTAYPILPGSVWGWGYYVTSSGTYVANTGNSLSPVQMGTDTTFARLAHGVGYNGTAAIKTNGTLWQLVVGTPNWVQIGTATTWADVWLGSADTGTAMTFFGTQTDGTMWAWGYNAQGQVGAGNTSATPTPVQVGTTWGGTALGAGICALSMTILRANGTLWIHGSDSYGQWGNGTTSSSSLTPVQIGTATDWAFVTCSGCTTFAIKQNGTLWAWGYNGAYNFGNGTVTNSTVPLQIGTASDWKSIIATGFANPAPFAFGLKTNDGLWGVGANNNGQLGNSTTVALTTWTLIGNVWKSISVSGIYMTAWGIRTNGTMWGWGSNNGGAVGTGYPIATIQSTPRQIGTGTKWSQVGGYGYGGVAIQAV